jgi:hypothetical protein
MRGHVRTAHDAIWLLAGHLWDAQFFEGCAVTGADAMGLRNTAVLSSVQHPVAQHPVVTQDILLRCPLSNVAGPASRCLWK